MPYQKRPRASSKNQRSTKAKVTRTKSAVSLTRDSPVAKKATTPRRMSTRLNNNNKLKKSATQVNITGATKKLS